MGLAVLVPLLLPLGVTIRPSAEVVGFHEAIEAVPEGSVVYLAADLDPGSQAELLPMLEVAVHQCARRDLKIVGACLWAPGPPLLEHTLSEIAADQYGKQYGRDFVNLGYKEGREVVMVTIANEIRSAFPSDYYGTPLDSIPMMAGIESFRDLKLLISISAGYPGTKEWVQQVQSRYAIPMISGCTAVSAPEYYPYIQSGQLQGLLGGLAGAAEYEVLNDIMGAGSRGMGAQSLGHIVVVFFIVAGNVLHLLTRRREGGAA